MQEVGSRKTELETPVLWVDLNKMERNISQLAKHFATAGVGWRPHIKGIKVPAIAHEALAAGAIGITCAKLSEAEVMAAAGIGDILIANQIVGHKKVSRLVNLCRHASPKVAVDNAENVKELGTAAQAKAVQLDVLIELEVGMKRCGVQPGADALELSRRVHQTPGLRFRGLMAWEGHAAVIKDKNLKRQEIEASIKSLTDTVALCSSAGLPVEIVSAGGSATFDVTPFLPGITEIQAGGAIFSDIQYRTWGVDTDYSLFVRSTVISRPTPDRIIFDAGVKALPAWSCMPKPIGLAGVKTLRMSAEHATITLEPPDTSVKVGEVFDFIVGYGDHTVFLHDHLYGIRDGVVEVVWEIQGRGKLR